MKVEFRNGSTVLAICECGARSFGDSAADCFLHWWEHVYQAHPDADEIAP